MYFEWDDEKAELNEVAHGVSFEEACEVFDDPNALEEFDVEHSTIDEERFRIIGLSSRRLLTVVYCERVGNVIRIISAWKSGPGHRRIYEQG